MWAFQSILIFISVDDFKVLFVSSHRHLGFIVSDIHVFQQSWRPSSEPASAEEDQACHQDAKEHQTNRNPNPLRFPDIRIIDRG